MAGSAGVGRPAAVIGVLGAGTMGSGIAHVAAMKFHASLFETRNVKFRTAAIEVVHRDNVRCRKCRAKRQRQIRADKTRAAGN